MLKDELIGQKKLNLKNYELLQKGWYLGLKKEIFNEIKNCLFDECDYIVPTDLQYIADNLNYYLTKYDECFDCCSSGLITCAYIFSFIRSKLWNEGINLLTTFDGMLWCVKIRKNEKYNDNYILPVSADDFLSLITKCSYKNDFNEIIMLYQNMIKKINKNTEDRDEKELKILNDFNELDNKALTVEEFNGLDNNALTIEEFNKINKKSKSRKRKKQKTEKIDDTKNEDGMILNTNIAHVSKSRDAFLKDSSIHTCHNGDYDAVSCAVNVDEDVIE